MRRPPYNVSVLLPYCPRTCIWWERVLQPPPHEAAEDPNQTKGPAGGTERAVRREREKNSESERD